MLTLDTLGALGYGLVACLSVALAVLLLLNWRGRLPGLLLAIAVIVNALWGAVFAVQLTWHLLPDHPPWALDALRALGWLLFLGALLEIQFYARPQARTVLIALQWILVVIVALLCLPFEHWLGPFIGDIGDATSDTLPRIRLFAQTLLAVAGLVLVEQIYRNTLWQYRQDIRFLCIGVGLLFAIDFFIYTDAFLFNRIDPALLALRGPLNLLVPPLVAISAARHPTWSVRLFVSRTLVIHTSALTAAGGYLILMSLTGYWIRLHDAVWGPHLQLLFLLAAGGILLLLFFSVRWRARARVFIAKHFFRSRYDYRHEWLRVTQSLSGDSLHIGLHERVIVALGELVDRPGGAIWVSDLQGRFHLKHLWQLDPRLVDAQWPPDDFALGLAHSGWILDLSEYARDPASYQGLDVPRWMLDLRHFSLVVPILFDSRLLAFVLLVRPLDGQSLNWEATDLLKTAAHQAASYLALDNTLGALTEARQFEGFNRVSAFVVHDLKNLIAQLSLVVSNAARHRDNPAFVEDAFATVSSAVEKMNRLLLHLRTQGSGQHLASVELSPLLARIRDDCALRQPAPQLILDTPRPLSVRADPQRLAAVLGNIVHNAQEATAKDGQVRIRLTLRPSREDDPGGDQALIEIEDTGSGMDADFVRERLFRPFDSTKGLAGMGIGAYDCREYVQSLGGQVEVESAPGQGTRFRIRLDLSDLSDADAPDRDDHAAPPVSSHPSPPRHAHG